MKKKQLIYHGKKVKLIADTYRNNGHLALVMYDLDDEEGYGFVITTNLNSPFQSDSTTFLDTNNFPDIDKFIRKNGLGLSMNLKERSGFCEYPLYHINVDAL